jgi:aldehyde:ferredoxin oxidoreductase
VDGAGGCYYAMLMGEQHFRLFDFLNAATGWNLNPDEYIEKGIRIQNLRQMFNARQGVDIPSFKMNGRAYGKPALKNGPTADVSFNLDNLIRIYNRSWGWDEVTGIPLNETPEKLGINEILTEKYSYGR